MQPIDFSILHTHYPKVRFPDHPEHQFRIEPIPPLSDRGIVGWFFGISYKKAATIPRLVFPESSVNLIHGSQLEQGISVFLFSKNKQKHITPPKVTKVSTIPITLVTSGSSSNQ